MTKTKKRLTGHLPACELELVALFAGTCVHLVEEKRVIDMNFMRVDPDDRAWETELQLIFKKKERTASSKLLTILGVHFLDSPNILASEPYVVISLVPCGESLLKNLSIVSLTCHFSQKTSKAGFCIKNECHTHLQASGLENWLEGSDKLETIVNQTYLFFSGVRDPYVRR